MILRKFACAFSFLYVRRIQWRKSCRESEKVSLRFSGFTVADDPITEKPYNLNKP